MNHSMASAGAVPTYERNVGLVAYATASTMLVALILLSNWPTYSYLIRGGFLPLYYYAVPGVLVIPLLFASPDSALKMLKEPLFWWFTVYVLLAVVWQVVAQDFSEEAGAQFRLRMLMFLLFTTIAILGSESRRPLVAVVIVGCVLVAGALNWFDALRPFRFVPQGYEHASEGRGAGLFINPNLAGSFAVIGTIAALPYIPMRLRAVALTAAIMCLAPTFSRGAFLLGAIAMVSAMGLKMLTRSQTVLVLVALPVLFTGVNLAYDYLMTHSEDKNMQRVVQRLMVLKDAGDEDESVDLRADAAARAWELFTQSPLHGAGLGETTAAEFVTGPHNMYLMLMADQGVFGLALYLSLVAILLVHGWRIVRMATTTQGADVGRSMIMLGLYLAANGFFSHNVLDEPHTIFLIAFTVAAGIQVKRAAGWTGYAAVAPRRPKRAPLRVGRW